MSVLDLFAGGEQGVWYDPSDAATVFQDAAMTTPAGADDPVGAIMDKSGNGNHATQSTADSRPIRKTDGNVWWLEFDGTDDILSTSSIDFSASDGATVGVAIRRPDTGSSHVIVELGSNAVGSAGFAWFLQPAGGTPDVGTASFAHRGSTTPGTALIDAILVNTDVSLIGRGDISVDLLETRLAGYVDNTDTDDQGTGSLPDAALHIGARTGAALPFTGRIYGVVVTTDNSTDAVDPMQEFLAEASNTLRYNAPLSSSTFLSEGFFSIPDLTSNVVIAAVGTTSEDTIREPGNILYEPFDTGKEYKHWYTGLDSSLNETIHYAYSSDGLSWTKYPSNPVAGGGAEAHLEDPYVLKVGSTYYMYCEDKGTGGQGTLRTRYLTSSDGINWTDQGRINLTLCQSPVVWKEGATWYLLYEDMTSPFSVHLATSSDGETWTENANNPVFTSNEVTWLTDGSNVVVDDLIKRGGTYYLFVHGVLGVDLAYGVITSSNLINWQDQSCNPLVRKDYYGVDDVAPNHAQIFSIGSDDYALIWDGTGEDIQLASLRAFSQESESSAFALVSGASRGVTRNITRNVTG